MMHNVINLPFCNFNIFFHVNCFVSRLCFMVCCHVHVRQRAGDWDSLYDVLPILVLVTVISRQA